MNEPVFVVTKPPFSYLPPGTLLLASDALMMATGHVHLGHQFGHHLLHCRADRAEHTALDQRSLPGVAGVAVHQGRHAARTWLALRFALHLGRHRLANRIPAVPCVTSSERPEPLPPRTTRIPHLLAVTNFTATPVGSVVWELMPDCEADGWLGAPLPDQAWFETHLPQLIKLRTLTSANQLPDDAVYRRLITQLNGRHFSIRFAYQHHHLIGDAVRALARDNQV